MNTGVLEAYDVRVVPVSSLGGHVQFRPIESLPPHSTQPIHIADRRLSPVLQELGIGNLYDIVLGEAEPAGPPDAIARFARPRQFTLRAEYADIHGQLYNCARSFRLLPIAMRIEAGAPVIELLDVRTG